MCTEDSVDMQKMLLEESIITNESLILVPGTFYRNCLHLIWILMSFLLPFQRAKSERQLNAGRAKMSWFVAAPLPLPPGHLRHRLVMPIPHSCKISRCRYVRYVYHVHIHPDIMVPSTNSEPTATTTTALLLDIVFSLATYNIYYHHLQSP